MAQAGKLSQARLLENQGGLEEQGGGGRGGGVDEDQGGLVEELVAGGGGRGGVLLRLDEVVRGNLGWLQETHLRRSNVASDLRNIMAVCRPVNFTVKSRLGHFPPRGSITFPG